MSGNNDDENGIGYRRPPKSGQFTKGRSGNPRGRPPKSVPQSEFVAARYPTRGLLRAEAARPITVTDASGRQILSGSEAVIRALALTAMRGGVLAQRTILQMHLAEDERFHRERQEIFDYWQTYQTKSLVAIEVARDARRPIPDPLPHPEDIRLDWGTLEIKFLGAVDEEGVKAVELAKTLQALSYELSVYLGEKHRLPAAGAEEGQLGLYMAAHILANRLLPPRFRRTGSDFDDDINNIVKKGVHSWGQDLKRRCIAVGLPFPKERGYRPTSFTFAQLGIQWPEKGARPTRPRQSANR